MATDISMHRYRISVPDDDEAAVAWFANQHNPSVSVRMLIKKHIEECGIGDIFSSRADGSKKIVVFSEEKSEKPLSSEDSVNVPSQNIDISQAGNFDGVPIVSVTDPLDILPSIGKEKQEMTIASLNAMLDN